MSQSAKRVLGDKCYKCGKRAKPHFDDKSGKRWHWCPRCGITFNKDTDTSYVTGEEPCVPAKIRKKRKRK